MVNAKHSAPQSENRRELMEEGRFHGRQFRRYSDGTLKAQTSSGWMKFSNYDEFCSYHWKRHSENRPQIAKSKTGWLKRIFIPPPPKSTRD